ncbi:hypothetical protein, partial [Schaalia hyovaginalis]
AEFGRRLADRRITLEVSEPARGWLTRVGYDPAYGARPLRRVIQKEIGDRLAKMLLAGEVAEGARVKVDIDEALDGLVMTSGAGSGDDSCEEVEGLLG